MEPNERWKKDCQPPKIPRKVQLLVLKKGNGQQLKPGRP